MYLRSRFPLNFFKGLRDNYFYLLRLLFNNNLFLKYFNYYLYLNKPEKFSFHAGL